MKRALLISSLLVTVLAAPAMAATQMYFGFQIGIASAPPPPRFVFHGAPHLMRVPSSDVFVVSDAGFGYDEFRYGSYWYVSNGGFWYRGASYGGPYVVIDVRQVPSPIFYVPRERWRHHQWGPNWVRYAGRDGERQAAWARERQGNHDRNWNADRGGSRGDRIADGSQRGPSRVKSAGPSRGQGQSQGHGHGNGNDRGRHGGAEKHVRN